MGLRFKKSIKIAPGVKLNLNKNSTSVTFGVRGAHYTVLKERKLLPLEYQEPASLMSNRQKVVRIPSNLKSNQFHRNIVLQIIMETMKNGTRKQDGLSHY